MTSRADNESYVNLAGECRGQGRAVLPPGALTDVLLLLPGWAWRLGLRWAGVTEVALHDLLCGCAEQR